MRSGIVLSSEEVRKIIAKHFNVNEDNVIKTKYSYIVIDAKCGDILKEQGDDQNGI